VGGRAFAKASDGCMGVGGGELADVSDNDGITGVEEQEKIEI